MLVVTDTSPLNYLVWIQQDTLLPILYDRVVIPPAVYEELQRPETPSRCAAVGRPSPRLADHPAPQQPLSGQQFLRLDDGELEAIPLAQELHADRLLMDERGGRRVARARGLIVIGTIGILETAAIRGLMDLPSVLAQLQATTFYASQRLYDEVLARDAARKANPPTDGR